MVQNECNVFIRESEEIMGHWNKRILMLMFYVKIKKGNKENRFWNKNR